jgi:hypothetical protein
MSVEAKRATWESIKRHRQVAELVRSDEVFRRFVGNLVETFGPLETMIPTLDEPIKRRR